MLTSRKFKIFVILALLAITLSLLVACGLAKEETSCTDHKWEQGEIINPTCYENGAIYYVCYYCHESKVETISSTGHNWYETSRDADCEIGDLVHYYCDACCESREEHLSPTDHSWVEISRSEPTCYSDIEIYYVCQNCNCGDTQYIATTVEHDWILESYYLGDCLSEGWEHYRCQECYDYKDVNTGLGSHDWQGSATAGCGLEGYFERVCYSCGAEENGSTLMLEHDIIHLDGSAPTCYYDGYKPYTQCTRCSYNTYETIPATDHANAKWIVTHKPTETTKGIRELHCDDCGDDFRIEVPESIYTDGLIYELKDSSYVVIGIDRRINPKTTTIAVPKTYMGIPITEIANGAFSGDTSIKAIDLSNSAITIINKEAFKDCTEITSVSFGGASYLSVGVSAFEGCTALTELSFGEQYTILENFAFSNCTALSTVSGEGYIRSIGTEAFINSDITSLDLSGSIDVIAERAFKGAKLSSLTISGNVTKISKSAFEGAGEGALVVSGYVDLIEEEAFLDSGFTSISVEGIIVNISMNSFTNIAATSLEISGTINTIEAYSFMGSKLLSFTVPEGGKIYTIHLSAFADLPLTSIDISGSIDTIESDVFRGAKITSLNICGTVGSIGFNSFSGSTIESFVITGHVNAIDSYAFNNCTSLKTVNLGESVKYIGYGFLHGCTSIRDLTVPFIGSENESVDDAKTAILADVFGNDSGENYSYALINAASVPSSLKNLTITSDNYISSSLIIGCKDLETVVLPECMYFGDGLMIEGCDSLITNEYDNGLYLGTPSNPYKMFVGIKDIEVNTCVIHENTFVISKRSFVNSKVWNLTIPENVYYIAPQAFYQNTYIQYVTMDNSVAIIGAEAFARCTSLIDVDVSNKLTIIGSRAFEECSSLQSFTIPYNMSQIGGAAFLYCTSMDYVYFARPYGWRAGSHTFGEYVSGTTPNGGAELSYVLSNPEKAAMNLRGSYVYQIWEFYPSLAE